MGSGRERTYQTLIDEILGKIDQAEGKHKLQQALITGIKSISTLNGNVLKAKASMLLTLMMCHFSERLMASGITSAGRIRAERTSHL